MIMQNDETKKGGKTMMKRRKAVKLKISLDGNLCLIFLASSVGLSLKVTTN